VIAILAEQVANVATVGLGRGTVLGAWPAESLDLTGSAATAPASTTTLTQPFVQALWRRRTGVRSASTTTLTLCYYGAATPSTLSVARGLPTGYEADAELIYVTGREKMQVVDHPIVTAHE
jgi:hypothetical protein